MKLRTKFLLFLLTLVLLSGGLIAALSRHQVRVILMEDVAKRGFLKAADLPASTVAAFRAGSEAELLPLLQEGLERTGAIYAIALDQKGRVVAHTNVVEKGKLYQDRFTLEALAADRPTFRRVDRGDLPVMDISLPVWAARRAGSGEEFLLFGGKELKGTVRLGTLRLGLPLGEALGTLDKIGRQMGWILAGTLGVALGLALLVMRRFLDRVRLLAEGTERIGRGEYGAEIPVFSRDELGDLALGFNRMSRELHAARTNLEKEVKIRTHELESFVYAASHDLKTPVVALQGMASMLLEDYGERLDEKGRYYIERIISNAQYMGLLIQGVLTLSRIGARGETGGTAEVREILREVLDLEKAHLAERKVEVVIQPDLPRFRLERARLVHIFQNLIGNAVKFMGAQPNPRIEIGGRELEEWIEFYVRDNGIGIDPAHHEKIFGVFQRLQQVDAEGTGVGLSIVRKTVELVGGAIRVESRKGEGTTFFIRLPREDRPRGET